MSGVGVFGGTFDPVHVGHLAIANAALDELGLDRVYFVPARRSPLKQDGPTATAEDRLAMLTAATGDEPRFHISRVELGSARPSRAPKSGASSIVSPRRSGERYPPVCTPVLNESSRRPVVSRIGNSSVISSTGGENSTGMNGAAAP